jgi:translation initiation factor 2 gamma subunit (eIF-2gamma)
MPRKKIIDDNQIKVIVEEYLSDNSINYLALSEKYNIPYSTIRRYILKFIESNNINNTKEIEYFPIEGFECMRPGFTFSWLPGGSIFEFIKKEKVYGELCWIARRTEKKGIKHFLPEDLEKC